MRHAIRMIPLLLLAACAGSRTAPAPAPVPFALSAATELVDGRSGRPVATGTLLDRMSRSDYVLLGEVHDNAIDHELRARLIDALASLRPAIVFEQFADADTPITPPPSADSLEPWLDAHGFDRKGWQWPLHKPVVLAAIAHARSMWGANVSRQTLMPVVMGGGADSTVPAGLRSLMEQAPLGAAGRAVLDSELVEGHCHQLPAEMIPGMRTAQIVRDAAMTRALLRAGRDGPAWLIAGNGHVRNDVAVPRLLRAAAPNARVLTVGILERDPDGGPPAVSERRMYDLVIITPRAERSDPCAQFRCSG
ncbi:MAG: ChaN family lipoprotein [Gemmatimonadaceae bacterium]